MGQPVSDQLKAALEQSLQQEARSAGGATGTKIMERVAMDTHYLLQFFTYAHLPPTLQGTSKPFGELAETIVRTLPNNPERTSALHKLLEAKDCAVRALLFRD